MHFLHNLLEAFSPRNTSVSVLKKVVLDRLIVTPPYLFFFFYIVALLEVSIETAYAQKHSLCVHHSLVSE